MIYLLSATCIYFENQAKSSIVRSSVIGTEYNSIWKWIFCFEPWPPIIIKIRYIGYLPVVKINAPYNCFALFSGLSQGSQGKLTPKSHAELPFKITRSYVLFNLHSNALVT